MIETLLQLILYASAILLFLWTFSIIAHLWLVFRIRIRPMQAELLNRSQMPKALSQLLSLPEEELTELGFTFSHCILINSYIDQTSENKLWQLTFYHSEGIAGACLTIPERPEPELPFQSEFFTRYDDKYLIRTLNKIKHRLIGPMLRSHVYDFCLPSLTEQWKSHQQVVRDLAINPSSSTQVSPVQACRRMKEETEEMLLNWEQTSWSKKLADGRWRLSMPAVFKTALKMFFGAWNLAGRSRKSPSIYTNKVILPIPMKIEGYQKYVEQTGEQSSSWRKKLGLFLASLAVFALSFSYGISLQTLILLILVLFVHELGHIIGMRIFGYKDLRILFLPFFGAVALGERANVPVYQRVIMYLLGPLPGILIGIVLLGISPEMNRSLLNEAGLIFVVLNVSNLLPIMPLDGGRIVNDILLVNAPRLAAFFSVFGALVLAAVGIYTESWMFILLAPILLLSTQGSLRRSQLLLDLKKSVADPRTATEEELLERIFEQFKNTSFAQAALPEQYSVVKYLLSNVRVPQMGPASGAVLLGFYFGVLLASPLAALILVL